MPDGDDFYMARQYGAPSRMKCPEDPLALTGMPIGMYHCPYCGCMQVAATPHVCDSDECLLENCDCLPEGVSRSPNLQGWLDSGREPPVEVWSP